MFAAAAPIDRYDPDLLMAKALGILDDLCNYGGSMRLSALVGGGDSATFLHQDPIPFLKQFPYFFRLESLTDKSDYLVYAHTRVQLCTIEDAMRNGCVNLFCEKLHLCKHFVTGRCRFGDKCTKKHNLRLPHNEEVLAKHHLNELDDRVIKLILKQSLVEYTVPDVCSHYNSTRGCKKGTKCPFVHVCGHYITGDCRFTNNQQQSCRNSHNLFDPQPLIVLQKFNLDTNQSPQELVKILRYKQRCAEDAYALTDGADDVDELGADLENKARVSPKRPGVGRRPQNSARPRERHSSTASVQSDEINVCVFHLRGKCNYAEKCHNIHSEGPYQWRYQDATSMQWVNFLPATNRQIEEAFCDVGEDWITVLRADDVSTGINNPGGDINFDKMQFVIGAGQVLDIKRVAPSSTDQGWRKTYITQWQWYWLDENDVWTAYGKENAKGMKSDINGITLEEAYENYQKDGGSRYLDFQTDYHEYRLDLETKMQKNIRYMTERKLRRRPKLVTKEALNERAERLDLKSDFSFPEKWDLYGKSEDPKNNFQLCRVDDTTDEYMQVYRRFNKTMPTACYKVDTIVRVQNIDLWEDFARKKNRMEKNCDGKKVREELLFHGTKQDVVEAICQQNFDWRLSGTRVGAMYGQGSYFHKAASYSNKYATPNSGKNQYMFVARVLAGSFTAGKRDIRKPPPKDPNVPHVNLYDTCVDNADDPSIFVVFENNQVYPEYLIKYQTK